MSYLSRRRLSKTSRNKVESLSDKNLDWILSYQSRVGPLKWIGPSTENIIIENSKIGKHIVLVPIAFVSEHSEPCAKCHHRSRLALRAGGRSGVERSRSGKGVSRIEPFFRVF